MFANCPQYPDRNPRPVVVRTLYMTAVSGVTKEIVELSTHSGTHCDAPKHFIEGGKAVDEISLEHFIAPAVIADVRGKEPGSSIGRRDLEALDLDIDAGDVVLFNTGFGQERANSKRFLTEYVWLDGDAAGWMLDRGARGAGIDAVSIGGYDDPEKSGPAHRALLEAGAFIVEDLFFPEEVMDGVKRLFVAAPVKLAGCGAGWTRAMLWEY